ncbi:MAG: transposase [bacterium]|nr:transposase [bacterium]
MPERTVIGSGVIRVDAPGRRQYSVEFKRRLVELALEPGPPVAGIALAHRINANPAGREPAPPKTAAARRRKVHASWGSGALRNRVSFPARDTEPKQSRLASRSTTTGCYK